ncbi:MAG: YidC/Oxa1 family membrane protein insertase, partial [Synergistaceae bacterium]|nr:YidC/Oxa1 family membrane protein insertase [Synergistaceae bacterium]
MGGLWDSIKSVTSGLMLGVLEFFQQLTGSYGMAIIILTIIVRLVLYPLSQKQMTSMTQMQKIQPRLKMLQEKYKDDKEKLNAEMMRLYKENNVNPMAGCLPLLVQLPIMIVLFQVLMDYKMAAGATFFGVRLELSVFDGLATAMKVSLEEGARAGITDVFKGIVTHPGGLINVGLYVPGLILTGLICFMMWYQQKMTGATNNPQMATMNVVMPVIMAFMCLGLPGGVVVYWGTSSLIGIIQQLFVSKKTKKELDKKPVLFKNKPVDGRGEVLTLESEEEYEEEEEYEDDDEEYEDEEDEYEDDEYE